LKITSLKGSVYFAPGIKFSDLDIYGDQFPDQYRRRIKSLYVDPATDNDNDDDDDGFSINDYRKHGSHISARRLSCNLQNGASWFRGTLSFKPALIVQ